MIFSSNGKKVVDLGSVAKPSSGYRTGGYGLTGSFAGRAVTRETAMGLPAFWSGVMLISRTCGTFPLETVDRRNRNAIVDMAGVAKRLRHQPNAETPASTFWTSVFSMLVANANAYLLKLPSSDDIQAPELYWLPPEQVQVYRGEDGEKRFDVYSADGGTFAQGVHARHIIHARGPSMSNPLIGASPVEYLRHSLGNALAAQEYQGAAYRSGGVPKGVLSVDEMLTPEQATTIRDQWHATYGGIENSGKVAVLDRGAKFQATGMSQKDSQFIEQMQLSATDCARILNLPAALINAEGASMTYANAAHNDRHFLRFTIRPYLSFIEQALNMDAEFFGVHSAWEPVFNTDVLGKGDEETRYKNYATAIGSGWMTTDEAREKEGLQPMNVEDSTGGNNEAGN
jgi:HK97 family phage portal protein